MLGRLREKGINYVFVSNSDNLGATLDLDLLAYFAQSGNGFLMEVLLGFRVCVRAHSAFAGLPGSWLVVCLPAAANTKRVHGIHCACHCIAE